MSVEYRPPVLVQQASSVERHPNHADAPGGSKAIASVTFPEHSASSIPGGGLGRRSFMWYAISAPTLLGRMLFATTNTRLRRDVDR